MMVETRVMIKTLFMIFIGPASAMTSTWTLIQSLPPLKFGDVKRNVACYASVFLRHYDIAKETCLSHNIACSSP